MLLILATTCHSTAVLPGYVAQLCTTIQIYQHRNTWNQNNRLVRVIGVQYRTFLTETPISTRAQAVFVEHHQPAMYGYKQEY